jgi:hypothetical protein
MKITGINAVVRFMSSKGKDKSLSAHPVVQNLIAPIKFRDGAVQLNLHVKPGAKVSRIADITENHIGLQV